MNPFLVLNLPATATDEQVRAAYRVAIQQNPPEGDAEKFQAVQEAWQQLQDERSRWKARLFPVAAHCDGPRAALLEYLQLPGRLQPLGQPVFQKWLQACAVPTAASTPPPRSAFAGRSSQPKKKKKR
jgi:hypothetical protein